MPCEIHKCNMDDSATELWQQIKLIEFLLKQQGNTWDLSTSLIHIYQTMYSKEENMYKV